MKTVRVGSRDSALAVAQARLVTAAAQRLHPGFRFELVTMKTSGDRLLDRSLEAAGGKGLFVKELDDALAAGRVDACVHSYKDLPVPDNPLLPVAATPARGDPRDALALPAGAAGGARPDPRLPVGTSSGRRRAQLAALFPGLRCRPVRGNVLTRLARLDEGCYGALLLAAAGLERLGLASRASRVFAVEEMIPAACQGILAVQVRAGERHPWLDGLDDPDARDAAAAERAFVQALGADCSAPVAAHARLAGDELRLDGWRLAGDGTPRRGAVAGPRRRAAALGRELAGRLGDGA